MVRGEDWNLESVASSSFSTSELEWLLARWAITPTTDRDNPCMRGPYAPAWPQRGALGSSVTSHSSPSSSKRHPMLTAPTPQRTGISGRRQPPPNLSVPLAFKVAASCQVSLAVGGSERKRQVCVISLRSSSVGRTCSEISAHPSEPTFLQSQAAGQPASAGTKRPPCWGEVTWQYPPANRENKKLPLPRPAQELLAAANVNIDGTTEELLSRGPKPPRCSQQRWQTCPGAPSHRASVQTGSCPQRKAAPQPGWQQLTSFTLVQHKVIQL